MNPSVGLSFLDNEIEENFNNPFLSETPPSFRSTEQGFNTKSAQGYALASTAATTHPSPHTNGAYKTHAFSPHLSYNYIADLESQLHSLIESDRENATRLSSALKDKTSQGKKWEAEREKLLLRIANLELEISELSENSRHIKADDAGDKTTAQSDSSAFFKPHPIVPSMITKGSPKGAETIFYLSKMEELNFELDQLMEEKSRIAKDYEKALKQIENLNLANAKYLNQLAFYQNQFSLLENEKSRSYDSIKGSQTSPLDETKIQTLSAYESTIVSVSMNKETKGIDISTYLEALENGSPLSEHDSSMTSRPEEENTSLSELLASYGHQAMSSNNSSPSLHPLPLEKSLTASSSPLHRTLSTSMLQLSVNSQPSSLQMLSFAKMVEAADGVDSSNVDNNLPLNHHLLLHPLTVGSWMWKYGPRGVRLNPELLTQKSISKSFYHLRFFWMHPSSATLFWSVTDDFANMKGIKSVKVNSVKVLKWPKIKIGNKDPIQDGTDAYLINATHKKCLYLIPCPL